MTCGALQVKSKPRLHIYGPVKITDIALLQVLKKPRGSGGGSRSHGDLAQVQAWGCEADQGARRGLQAARDLDVHQSAQQASAALPK